MLKLIKLYFTLLSVLNPKMAGSAAFNVFQKVRKKTIRKREETFYSEAREYSLTFEKEDLTCYQFGPKSKDLVLLVHGWDSNAGCMHGFVQELVKKEKHVVSFNFPAHAFYKASKTNFYECKKALQAVLRGLPEHDNLSIISHSFGSAVSAYALSEIDIKIDRLIFLTSLNAIEDVFLDFKKMIGLNKKSYRYLIEKADNILGEKLSELSIDQKLGKANFNQLHLIHDKNDKVIPYSNTLRINNAISNSTLRTYENVGHYRMLWNPNVISTTMSYFNN